MIRPGQFRALLTSATVPVKYEHVVFCAPSQFQLDIYRHFIHSPDIKKLLKGQGCQPLKMVGILRKLCNHPDLLDLADDIPGSEKYFPIGYSPKDRKAMVMTEFSGKMVVLERSVLTVCWRAHCDTDFQQRAGSFTRSARRQTTRSCSSVTTRRRWTSSTRCAVNGAGAACVSTAPCRSRNARNSSIGSTILRARSSSSC